MPRVIFVNSWEKSVLNSSYFPYLHNYNFQMQNLNIPVLTFKAYCVYVCKPFYNSSHCYYLIGTTLNCLLSQKVYAQFLCYSLQVTGILNFEYSICCIFAVGSKRLQNTSPLFHRQLDGSWSMAWKVSSILHWPDCSGDLSWKQKSTGSWEAHTLGQIAAGDWCTIFPACTSRLFYCSCKKLLLYNYRL